MQPGEPVASGGGGLTMSEEGGLEEVDESFCAAASFSLSCRTVPRNSSSCFSSCRQRGHDFLARLLMILHDRNRRLQWHYEHERVHHGQIHRADWCISHKITTRLSRAAFAGD